MKTNTPTDNTSEIDLLISELLHCQQMIDWGGKNWDKYGPRLTATKAKLQAYISKRVREELETLKQTEFNRNAMGDITSLEEVLDARLEELNNATED